MKTNMVCIAAIFVIAVVVLVIAIRKLILFITEKIYQHIRAALLKDIMRKLKICIGRQEGGGTITAHIYRQ